MPFSARTAPARYKRSRDQDPRRRLKVEPLHRLDRLREMIAAGRRNSHRPRGVGDRLRRQRVFLIGNRDRHHAPRETGEVAQECLAVLTRQHPDHHHQRTRYALFKISQDGRDHATAIGVMAAVKPEFTAGRHQFDQSSARQALHPGRPLGIDDALLERRRRNFQMAEAPQRGNGHAGILELVAARQLRRLQIKQSVFVLIDQTPAFFRCHPVFARDPDRCTDARGVAFDRGQRLTRLRGDDCGYAGF